MTLLNALITTTIRLFCLSILFGPALYLGKYFWQLMKQLLSRFLEHSSRLVFSSGLSALVCGTY